MNYSYKDIWLISYPVMMSVLMEQLINITDAIFLGHVGEIELGASAIAGIYYLIFYIIGFGFSLGLQVVIARRNGEGKYKETGKVFFQGLYFLLGLAILLFVLSQFISPIILSQFLTSGEIYGAVMDYLDYRMFGLLFTFPALALRSFFVGIVKTRMLSLGALLALAANVILNYLLIFGNCGFPILGISGAAIASTLSELVFFLVILGYMIFRINKSYYGLVNQYDGKILKQLFHLSKWSMLYSFISIAPWLLFFIAIEHLGEDQLAIANIIRSISTVFFVIVNSFAATTSSLVSNLIGAGENRNVMPLCFKIVKLAYFIGAPLIVIFILFSDQIFGFYTNNNDLIENAFWPFLVMLLNYFMSVVGYVYCNAVSGTGKTMMAFIFKLIVVSLYLVYLFILSNCEDVPLAVYWTLEYLWVIILFILSYIYLRKGNWQTKVV